MLLEVFVLTNGNMHYDEGASKGNDKMYCYGYLMIHER